MGKRSRRRERSGPASRQSNGRSEPDADGPQAQPADNGADATARAPADPGSSRPTAVPAGGREPAAEAGADGGQVCEEASASTPAATGDGDGDGDVVALRVPGRDRGKPPIPEPDIGAAQLRILYELYRWIVLRAELPDAEEWRTLVGFPHPAEVDEAFGGWDGLLEAAQVADAEALLRLREAEEVVEQAERQRRVLTERAERHTAQVTDLQRRLERTREKVDRERDARREAERLAAEAQAHSRAAQAELEQVKAAAERAGTAPEADPELVEALGAELAEEQKARAAAEQRAEAASLAVDEAVRALEERDRQLVELNRALAALRREHEGDGGDGESAEDGEPRSVLEAVMRARERCPHLTFADSAITSAADSPFGRPQLILEMLERLDGLAERYLQGAMGGKLADVALQMGIPWRGGVSETARTRNPQHYRCVHQGQVYPLGPHVALGSGSGAGRIARIYLCLHEGDEHLGRAVLVGHVGRHLPDTTT